MAFLKVGDTVINTAAIAYIDLKPNGDVWVTMLTVDILESHAISEWLEFTGTEAEALRKYFSKTGNVVNLTD